MTLTHGPTSTNNGLILCLDALNPRSYPGSGTQWNDISGSGNHFSLANVPTFTGSTFSFDGISQSATIGSSSLDIIWGAGVQRTIELWFKFNAWTVNGPMWGDQSGTNGLLRTPGDGTVGWTWDDSGYVARTNKVFQIGEWGHIVVLLEGYSATYYTNGNLDTPQFTSTDLGVAGNTVWTLARQNRDTVSYFNCEIAIAKQYSRLLNAEEIFQNFQAFRGRFNI